MAGNSFPRTHSSFLAKEAKLAQEKKVLIHQKQSYKKSIIIAIISDIASDCSWGKENFMLLLGFSVFNC
jgi:hypothetical protein